MSAIVFAPTLPGTGTEVVWGTRVAQEGVELKSEFGELVARRIGGGQSGQVFLSDAALKTAGQDLMAKLQAMDGVGNLAGDTAAIADDVPIVLFGTAKAGAQIWPAATAPSAALEAIDAGKRLLQLLPR